MASAYSRMMAASGPDAYRWSESSRQDKSGEQNVFAELAPTLFVIALIVLLVALGGISAKTVLLHQLLP